MRARIVMVTSDPSSAVGFPDLLKDNWQTNDSVPLRIDCFRFFGFSFNNFNLKILTVVV